MPAPEGASEMPKGRRPPHSRSHWDTPQAASGDVPQRASSGCALGEGFPAPMGAGRNRGALPTCSPAPTLVRAGTVLRHLKVTFLVYMTLGRGLQLVLGCTLA